jgi:hypothetical protein
MGISVESTHSLLAYRYVYNLLILPPFLSNSSINYSILPLDKKGVIKATYCIYLGLQNLSHLSN